MIGKVTLPTYMHPVPEGLGWVRVDLVFAVDVAVERFERYGNTLRSSCASSAVNIESRPASIPNGSLLMFGGSNLLWVLVRIGGIAKAIERDPLRLNGG